MRTGQRAAIRAQGSGHGVRVSLLPASEELTDLAQLLAHRPHLAGEGRRLLMHDLTFGFSLLLLLGLVEGLHRVDDDGDHEVQDGEGRDENEGHEEEPGPG